MRRRLRWSLVAAALLPIAARLHAMFDRPGVTLEVAPVVVSGGHAIAGAMTGLEALAQAAGDFVAALDCCMRWKRSTCCAVAMRSRS